MKQESSYFAQISIQKYTEMRRFFFLLMARQTLVLLTLVFKIMVRS